MSVSRRVAMLLAIFAIIVATVGASPQPNPTKAEYQANKAAKDAAVKAAAAKESKMAAVNKAAEMLKNLQVQVLKEGEDEAETYNKFACFCKDTTSDKLANIDKNEDERASLIAEIEKLSKKRVDYDVAIKEAEDDVATHTKALAHAKQQRAKTKKEYQFNAADLDSALAALRGAIDKLKAGQPSSFAQVSDTIRTAATYADALGLGSQAAKKSIAVFMQLGDAPANKVNMDDYSSRSDDIISTLQDGLLPEFTKKKTELDEEEVKSVKEYEMLVLEKTHSSKTSDHKSSKAKKLKEDTAADIEAKSERLSTVDAALVDDKEYMNNLAQMCTDKAKTWDQRKKARAAEVQTLTQAITVVVGAVSAKTTAATIRFAQTSATISLAEAVASDPDAMEDIEAAAQEVDAPPSFVQLTSSGSALAAVRRLRGSPEDGAEAGDSDGGKSLVASLLATQGEHLKSNMLMALATRITADPLAKVKQLIQRMVDKLTAEAASEASQKAWCDKAMAEATEKRDYAAEEIRTINGDMANLEATRDQLTEDLAQLVQEIKDLKAAQDRADKERKEEEKQNEKTISEAKEGLSALNMCIDVLAKFYRALKKESVDLSLAQTKGPMDDAPDAGFGNGEAYTGSQAASGGIMGMLDVMQADFKRTIEITRVTDRKAEDDHFAFMTESATSQAKKENVHKQKTEQKAEVVQKLDEEEDDLEQQTNILSGAIKELLELKPACIDTGMSYEERVARREDELKALQKALCILERYAEFGPNGIQDGCD